MVLQSIRSFYILRRSKKIFHTIEKIYQRKSKTLSPDARNQALTHLAHLQEAILAKNPEKAKQGAKALEGMANVWMLRNFFEKARDFILAFGVALLIAMPVRQMWFELYTIPTGSMRPTLKEKDLLLVSKNSFGLNVPFTTAHFTFDPSLVQRGDIVVWTGENLNIPDSDIRYFYLFPGKKQFVKRLIGKPGDMLYFYGGKIYGIDAQGKEITDLRSAFWSQSLEHIPFIHLEGKTAPVLEKGMPPKMVFSQMNQPLAEIRMSPLGWLEGEVLGKKENPLFQYSDFWGMKNYAKARLLTKEQYLSFYPKSFAEEGALLYLELAHHPSVKDPKMEGRGSHLQPTMQISTSVLPLKQEHLQRLSEHMTTCRFVVQDGVACRVGMDPNDATYRSFYPHFASIPNGTYEIQDGVASQIYVGGISKTLAKDHPLYLQTPQMIQALYNLGIEFLTQYEIGKQSNLYPSRYAYFRTGNLCLLNAEIMFADDPLLQSFCQKEIEKGKISTSIRPYMPFIDAGAPLKADGSIDVELIRKYGLAIPEKMYLMLGDNHAMSADSREFGFVPQDNLKGVVSFLFSPPGERWGVLPQPGKAFLIFPQFFVWFVAISSLCGYEMVRRKRFNKFLYINNKN